MVVHTTEASLFSSSRQKVVLPLDDTKPLSGALGPAHSVSTPTLSASAVVVEVSSEVQEQGMVAVSAVSL